MIGAINSKPDHILIYFTYAYIIFLIVFILYL
jgi:hypothetical protein